MNQYSHIVHRLYDGRRETGQGESQPPLFLKGYVHLPKVSILIQVGVHFDHIDALRNAAREMAAAAIKKSGQF
jgi:hypothetical protein